MEMSRATVKAVGSIFVFILVEYAIIATLATLAYLDRVKRRSR
jgi:hypothetical protein